MLIQDKIDYRVYLPYLAQLTYPAHAHEIKEQLANNLEKNGKNQHKTSDKIY